MAEQTIAGFWAAMGSNDFAHASAWLHPDFEYYMPQTGEYLRGRNRFAALNAAYPAAGRWVFTVHAIVAQGSEGVSDVMITDGVLRARAITFHQVQDGLILRQREYWPDDYPAPDWRAPWVEIVESAPF